MNRFVENFQSRIKTKRINVSVVGLGYVGLPLAISFAKKGFFVLGIDLDHDRIERLNKRQSYITDVSNSELISVFKSKKFEATTSFLALNKSDVVFICVPTPLKRKYQPDISFIKGAVSKISGHIKRGALVVLESTTYPGTTEEVILPMFQERGFVHGKDFYLCFSPERIDPGNTYFPLHKITKVIGGINPDAALMGRMMYNIIIKKVVLVSSTRVAETVKLLENTFRIVNIGLIDEMAMMCNRMNMDIWEIIDAAKTKPFGFMAFYPGPGVGGHCIPKDPLYLYWKARHFGFRSRFIKLASDIINAMPGYVCERVRDLLGKINKTLAGSRILVVGVTYKRDIKDLRKSPALDIIDILKKAKSAVSYYDPLIPYLKFNHVNLKSIELIPSSVSGYDCVIIATDHTGIDYELIRKKAKIIFDTRNIYSGIEEERIIKL